MLCRLLYVSRISPDAATRLAGAMENILVASVRSNRRDALTGFLLADGDSFAQVLEGPDARVVACYERILRDARHHDVRMRFLARIDERSFPRWSMCGLSLSQLDDSLLHPPDIAFDLNAADAGPLLQHLSGISLRHARRLDTLHERLLASAS